jgi:hypothetical protein
MASSGAVFIFFASLSTENRISIRYAGNGVLRSSSTFARREWYFYLTYVNAENADSQRYVPQTARGNEFPKFCQIRIFNFDVYVKVTHRLSLFRNNNWVLSLASSANISWAVSEGCCISRDYVERLAAVSRLVFRYLSQLENISRTELPRWLDN